HQSGDVHEFDDRRGLLIRLIHLRQLVQPLVRHRYHAH
ncbi:YqzL-like protein, partial [Dysosmobacter welbionis]